MHYANWAPGRGARSHTRARTPRRRAHRPPGGYLKAAGAGCGDSPGSATRAWPLACVPRLLRFLSPHPCSLLLLFQTIFCILSPRLDFIYFILIIFLLRHRIPVGNPAGKSTTRIGISQHPRDATGPGPGAGPNSLGRARAPLRRGRGSPFFRGVPAAAFDSGYFSSSLQPPDSGFFSSP